MTLLQLLRPTDAIHYTGKTLTTINGLLQETGHQQFGLSVAKILLTSCRQYCLFG